MDSGVTHLQFEVNEEKAGARLDVFAVENIENMSRSGVQRLIDENLVLVNGKPVKPSYKVKANDNISMRFIPPKELDITAEQMDLDILYEDKELIVVNKSKGVVVHPGNGHYEHTLVNGLLYHCKGGLSGINGIMRPGIVHRIDKDTSGVLVAAKNDAAHNALSAQLADHSMTRVYEAIASGYVKQDELTINKPISRNESDRLKMAVNEKNGKHAVTHITVIKRYKNFTHVAAKLETGRTHQIRVHMAYINHPLVGDAVYGRKNTPFQSLGQVLHAKILGFRHPVTNEYMEFCARLPDYFKNVIEHCNI